MYRRSSGASKGYQGPAPPPRGRAAQPPNQAELLSYLCLSCRAPTISNPSASGLSSLAVSFLNYNQPSPFDRVGGPARQRARLHGLGHRSRLSHVQSNQVREVETDRRICYLQGCLPTSMMVPPPKAGFVIEVVNLGAAF